MEEIQVVLGPVSTRVNDSNRVEARPGTEHSGAKGLPGMWQMPHTHTAQVLK